jgi:hypothetical protein
MKLETVSFDGKQWTKPMPDLDSANTLVLVFGASSFIDDPAPLAELKKAFPRAHALGCSSAGEISGVRIADGSLSVAIARFDSTHLRTAMAPVSGPSDSFGSGETLARALDQPGLRAVLILSDGLNVNGSELVRGVNSVLPEGVIVTGGLAGDGDRFKRTWVLADAAPKTGVVCAVGFYGDKISVGHGSKGGWDKFGPERLITRSESNVLYELDGKPALALYKEYLGARASELPSSGLLFPLAIRATNDDEKFLVRTILAVDDAAQSLTFAGDMPRGHRAQLMKANFDRLIGGAADAAQMARSTGKDGAGDTLAIAISCVGRRLVLGQRAEEELEATIEGLPPSTTQVGFYSYGEISPYAKGRCDLHNQTMTLTAITEH